MPSDFPATPKTSLRARSASFLEEMGMLIVLALLLIGCAMFVPNFATLRNLDSLLLAVSTVGIISSTMLFCLASGNFDLSVGPLVPCAGVVAAVIIRDTDSVALGLAGALGVGALVGLVNGLLVAKAKINPLITTLGTMQIVKGLALIVSGGLSVGINKQGFFAALGSFAFPDIRNPSTHAPIFRIPMPVWFCLACFALFGFLLRRTIFGRNVLAIGGNPEAARLAGIRVDRTVITVFVLQGLVAALAGIILASRLTSGQPKTSEGLELQVIAACVLGGVSLTGGVGKMSFVIAGVFIMGVVQNAMNLQGVDPFYQYVASGTILLAAVLFDRLKQRF